MGAPLLFAIESIATTNKWLIGLDITVLQTIDVKKIYHFSMKEYSLVN